MSEKNKKFPGIKKSIQDFIDDEDGSITRSKLVTVGSMVLLMTHYICGNRSSSCSWFS